MPNLACTSAQMTCSFGTAPSVLNILPLKRVTTSNLPAATIMDNIPFVNIPPFAMCTSLANPTVAAATTAALGVLTPMPCIPFTTAPWIPGKPTILIGNVPALDNTCKCMCTWGGCIQFSSAGQFTVSD
ncbi:DUF4280 domain-containing protein [Flavivirga jejuensis]|uniref:DUF4280 domain-containing protein n=1 Tax=Flavivirga jejuensis TaxID=870487 RepID=A0ABT8WP08_9FLAO|nr:DUF4280 domain-containing protein [Flavivirga jejuensis]MDO5974912.1 DUF4280 domain-containing protein [Flavivirga jejuensis]